MKTLRYSLAAIALTLACGLSSAFAQVLVSDNFDSVALGANINGRTPTENNVNSNTWVANTANFLGDGSGSLSVTTGGSTSASVDLGSSFFASNAGIYELSLDMTMASNASGNSWMGLGFASGNSTTEQLVNNGGAPWLLFRRSGAVTVFGGSGTSNNLLSTTASLGTAHSFLLQLDTTQTNWVLNAYLDGVQLDLDSGGPGMSFTYSTNPASIRYIQMAAAFSGSSSGDNGIMDNILLTSAVPEPTAAALLSFVGLLALRRRRG